MCYLFGCDGAMVATLDFDSKGPEFDPCQLHFAKILKILSEKLENGKIAKHCL